MTDCILWAKIQDDMKVANFDARQTFMRYQDLIFLDPKAQIYYLLLLESYRTESWDLVKAWPESFEPTKFRLQFTEAFVGNNLTPAEVGDWSVNKKSWRTAQNLLRAYSQVYKGEQQ